MNELTQGHCRNCLHTTRGCNGRDGVPGATGTQGKGGRDGKKGDPGAVGPPEPPGHPGPLRGVTGGGLTALPTLYDVHLHNMPCTVCCGSQSKVLMIPAKMSCPSDPQIEYCRYLMGPHATTNYRAAFLCMDKDPEVVYSRSRS